MQLNALELPWNWPWNLQQQWLVYLTWSLPFCKLDCELLKISLFCQNVSLLMGAAHNGVNHFSLLMPRMWFVTFCCVSVSPLCCLLQHFAWLLSMSTLNLNHSVFKEILIRFLLELVKTFRLDSFQQLSKIALIKLHIISNIPLN